MLSYFPNLVFLRTGILNNFVIRYSQTCCFHGCFGILLVWLFAVFVTPYTLQVKGLQNVGPKRKGAVFLLKWFGPICCCHGNKT